MFYDVSFVIPAFNEEKHIVNAISSIGKFITNLRSEIIVVDNGSTDNTKHAAMEQGAKVYSIERTSVAAARNFGARLSGANVIAFIDGDTRVTEQWGKELSRQFQYIANSSMITGARCIIPETPSRIEMHWFLPLSKKNITYINSANLIVNRNAFESIGGFCETLETGEDYDLSRRAKEHGIQVLVNPNYTAIHDGFPTTLSAFFKRELWHGKGDFSSLSSFLKSHVALTSVVFGILQALFLGSALGGNERACVLLLAVNCMFLLAVSTKLFITHGYKYIFYNLPLCYIYLTARLFSGFVIIKDAIGGGSIIQRPDK